jgi:cell division protein FtsB
MILDRILGKPKMVTENKNLNLNYQDFLMEIARTDGDESKSEEPIIEVDSQPITE